MRARVPLPVSPRGRASAGYARSARAASELDVGDIRLEWEALHGVLIEIEFLQQRARFARPVRVVDLVERNDASARNPRQQMRDRGDGRLVLMFKIEIQERDQQVLVRREVFGDGLDGVTANHLDLADLIDEAVGVVFRDAGLQLGKRVVILLEHPGMDIVGAAIFRVNRRKAAEGVKSDNLAPIIVRLECAG